ncbi:MAG: methionyl-tRNA formyltransferase [Omnitrophica bacterium]|nr:methionyl-tRNA formyltransferase [Candidatus Omnitrophota bacterium]
MRYLFIGSVEYSAHCLKALLEMNIDLAGIMCPKRHTSRINSDYADLGTVAREYGRNAHYFENIKDEADYVLDCKPDAIFVLGLSQIIPKNILKIPTVGCIGSHLALLPYNRGRHPIIWTIANGLTKCGVSLFWLDEGVDSGDIWTQKEFEIFSHDDARGVYKKATDLTIDLLREKIPELKKGIITRVRQDAKKANYWRKRTPEDGEIDWRMSSKRIYDLVRALAKPYAGAHCVVSGKKIKVWKTKIIEGNNKLQNLEPGVVLKIEGDHILVKTGDGVIELAGHEFIHLPKKRDYLL